MAIRTAISGRSLKYISSSVGARSLSSLWRNVEPAPKDPILGVTEAFLADPTPHKVNVGVGAYRDDNGKPVVLECVREAERRIAGSFNISHVDNSSFIGEYLPMGGSVNMIEESLKLAYGENSDLVKDKRIAQQFKLYLGLEHAEFLQTSKGAFVPIHRFIFLFLHGLIIITFGEMLMSLRKHIIIIILKQKGWTSLH